MRKFYFLVIAFTFIFSAQAYASSKAADCFLNSIPPTVTPTFNQIGPICQGSIPPFLPSTSLNGITGTWWPATISNQVSSTYTFTPEPGQNATTTTMNIFVVLAPNAVLSGEQSVCVGSTTTFNASIGGGTWNSLDSSIASVNTSSGVITGVQAGNTTIFYTIPPNSSTGCPAVTTSKAITVNQTVAPPTVYCGIWVPSYRTFSWNVVLGATNYTVSYTINGGPVISAALGAVNTFIINGVSQTDDIVIHVAPSSPSNTCFQVGTTGCNISTCPTAGLDGATIICDSSTAPINLYSLISGEDFGGTWLRVLGSGGTFDAANGTFVPAAGATTSAFLYSVIGANPCPNDSSIATVNINRQPNAGFDGCISVLDTNPAAIDLYSLITGEDSQGVWTRTIGVGGTFNAVSGTYSPAIGATVSTFSYTVVGAAPCINDTSTANVIINGPPMGDAVTLFCEAFPPLFPNDVVFDWNNVGQTSFNYYYSINGSIVSGNTLVSNFVVPNVPIDASVYFNVQPIGNICFPSTFTICNMLANTVFESDVITHYPNPFNDILNLKFAEPVKSIQITNVLGQQVFSSDHNEKDFQINLAHLSSGTYFVRAQMAKGFKTFKIVKN